MIYYTQYRTSDPITGESDPELLLSKEFYERGHPVFSPRRIELPRERYRMDYLVDPSKAGETLDPSLFPSVAKFSASVNAIKDFYDLGGWRIVSTRVKNKIEELEPGIHQFVPLRIQQSDGSEPWPPFYFFNIRQVVFSIDVAKSPCYRWHRTSVTPASEPAYAANGTKTLQLPFDRASYQLQFDRSAKPLRMADGRDAYLVYRSSVVGNKTIWREYLDLNTPPNSGKRMYADEDGYGIRMVFGQPADPGDWDVYRLQTDFGFRATDQFKNWAEANGVRLEFVNPGCLDSELESLRND